MSSLTWSYEDPPVVVPPAPELAPPSTVEWTVQVTDRNGVGVAFLDVQSFKLTRRFNGAATFAGEVEASGSGAAEIGVADRMIRAYRRVDGEDGVPRFCGQIVGPLLDQGDPDGMETVSVVAHDPFNVLLNRNRTTAVEFVNHDQGAIAEALLAAENVRAETGLRMGSYPQSVRRDRSYELGKNVGEAVEQLAGVLDGFWFVVDAADEGPVAGYLNLRHPRPGVERLGVSWQYGPETLGNLEDVRIEAQTPVNRVLAIGATDSDTQNTLTVVVEDAASIARYGLWEKVVSHTDVSIESTLMAHAQDALSPEPVQVYTLTPALPALDGPTPPRLFDDFDVGDTVHILVRGRSERLLAEDMATVTQVTVEYDEEGTERITELALQAPITGRLRASSRGRLLEQLREDARRISDLEIG